MLPTFMPFNQSQQPSIIWPIKFNGMIYKFQVVINSFGKSFTSKLHFKLSSISGFGQPILTQTLKSQLISSFIHANCKLQFVFVLFCGKVFATG